MKAKIGILVLALFTTFLTVQAQRRVVTTTRAMSYDISDNLDLEAVASIFGDSENLEDFEYRLNDPDNRISNLDLNEDGYIDYLRVVENSSDRNSLVVIQAVLDEDIYQDVATIEIEKVNNGRLRVQIVGDAYIYGSNYIIEPVFVSTPVIFSFFWSSHYRPYYSPYYWNYYPRWYSYYRPYPTYKYHRHVHRHINEHITYHRPTERYIHFSRDRYDRVGRSDYASRYPDRAFSKRNDGYSNKYELERRRPTSSNTRDRNTNVQRPNNREYQYNGQSSSGRKDRSGNVYQSRRPSGSVQSGSENGRTRESNQVNVERNRPNSSNEQVQVKSGTRNESRDGGSVSRGRNLPSSSPNRPGNQVDSRKSTPREKSGTITNRSRVSGENKQAPQNNRKSEAPKNEEHKGSDKGRRR